MAFLASLFDKFKLRSPKAAAAVLLVLFTLVAGIKKAIEVGVFPENNFWIEALRVVGVFLLAVTGARTTQFLPATLRGRRENDYSHLKGVSFYTQDNSTESGDPLTRFLARLFDYFKQANPKAAAWVLVLLVMTMVAAQRGVLLQVFSLPGWADDVLFAISAFLTAVSGARTVSFLPLAARKVREAEYAQARRLAA